MSKEESPLLAAALKAAKSKYVRKIVRRAAVSSLTKLGAALFASGPYSAFSGALAEALAGWPVARDHVDSLLQSIQTLSPEQKKMFVQKVSSIMERAGLTSFQNVADALKSPSVLFFAVVKVALSYVNELQDIGPTGKAFIRLGEGHEIYSYPVIDGNPIRARRSQRTRPSLMERKNSPMNHKLTS